MKNKKEACNFLNDECDLYIHPLHLSNKKYFAAVFSGEIKVSFFENFIKIKKYFIRLHFSQFKSFQRLSNL